MRSDWTTGQLGDFFEIVTGGTPPKTKKEMYGAYMPLVKPPELNGAGVRSSEDYLSEVGVAASRVLPIGSVLVSCIGNLGKVGISEVELATNQQINSIKPDARRALPEFVFYLVQSPDFMQKLHDLASGTTIPIVNKSKFKSIPIDLPTIPEQKRIVTILDEAFGAINAAIANTEKNLANARELFESYLNSVFGESARDWVTAKIGTLVQNGILDRPTDGNHGEIHPKKADFVSSGVPFIMAADLVNGRVNQSECNFLTEEQANSLRKGFASDGDVLLSHKGTIGRAAILETELDYVMLTPQVTYYRVLKPEILSRKFLFYACQSPGFLREMNHIAGAGSTRAYIGITKQLELQISYPPREQQERYAEAFDELSQESKRLEQLYKSKLSALKELKQSLLHKTLSGELTEDEPEKKINEVAA